MGERTAGVVDADMAAVLAELEAVIKQRSSADPDSSYTAQLLGAPEEKLFKKLAEESLELALASKDDDHDHIRYEAADLLYHLLVLMQKKGISLAELAGELKARMK